MCVLQLQTCTHSHFTSYTLHLQHCLSALWQRFNKVLAPFLMGHIDMIVSNTCCRFEVSLLLHHILKVLCGISTLNLWLQQNPFHVQETSFRSFEFPDMACSPAGGRVHGGDSSEQIIFQTVQYRRGCGNCKPRFPGFNWTQQHSAWSSAAVELLTRG